MGGISKINPFSTRILQTPRALMLGSLMGSRALTIKGRGKIAGLLNKSGQELVRKMPLGIGKWYGNITEQFRMFRLQNFDGGDLLALRIYLATRVPLALKREMPLVISLDHRGLVKANGFVIGSSFGTRHLGLSLLKNKQKRIIIAADSKIGVGAIKEFIAGLNNSDLNLANGLQGRAVIVSRDNNYLPFLTRVDLPLMITNPGIGSCFNDKELGKLAWYYFIHETEQPSNIRELLNILFTEFEKL